MVPDAEIAGIVLREEQRERSSIAEEAVAAAEPESPTSAVSLPGPMVTETGLRSGVDGAAHKLLTADQDQREALPESGHVACVCFPSQAMVLSDPRHLYR